MRFVTGLQNPNKDQKSETKSILDTYVSYLQRIILN